MKTVKAAFDSLSAKGIEATNVFVGMLSIEASGLDMDVLLSDLHSNIGYPYDTILPGLFKARMLEVRVSSGIPAAMSLCMVKDWGAALQAVDIDVKDGAPSPLAPCLEGSPLGRASCFAHFSCGRMCVQNTSLSSSSRSWIMQVRVVWATPKVGQGQAGQKHRLCGTSCSQSTRRAMRSGSKMITLLLGHLHSMQSVMLRMALRQELSSLTSTVPPKCRLRCEHEVQSEPATEAAVQP